jgi:predicted phosphodiesterase
MRIAVFSDIHGNAIALNAMLADLERDSADHLICLGDAIQGGPQPAEVVARLRELACPVVMGNADAYLLTGEASDAESVPEERRRRLDDIRAWSLARLSEADRAYMGSFRPTVEIPLADGRSLLGFHGSPASFDHLIWPTTPEAEFQAMLAPHLPRLMAGGHTHLQQLRRIGRSDSLFFNPGSVGLAYSHEQPDGEFRADSWAEYAVLTVEPGRLRLEFCRAPFDARQLIEVYQASGRPHPEAAIAQYTH